MVANGLGAPVVIVGGQLTGGFVNGIPEELITSGGIDGTNPRLRVDVGQTGFFAGREFRTYKEWSSATTETYVVKVIVPINTILMELAMTMEAGSARLETVVGGTEGGTFSEVLPIFPANTMTERPTPFYTPVITASAGGTHTGGTVLDIFRMSTAGNANFSSSVGGNTGSERGVGPGTYYLRFTLTGVIGIFKIRYEERP